MEVFVISLNKIKACFPVIAGFVLVIASIFIITTCKSPTDQFNDDTLNTLTMTYDIHDNMYLDFTLDVKTKNFTPQ